MRWRTFLALLLAYVWLAAAEPLRIIFDTDIGNDIDDALALAMLHAMETAGEAKLLAVTITKDNPWAPVYVDLANHFYGRGGIPIGMVKGGPTPEDSPYLRVPAARRGPGGGPLYPRRIESGTAVPDATTVLRDVLSKEKDSAVTIVQVGFSTNLARLLQSPGGADLVKRKVRLLVMMAGEFPTGKPEYNIRIDIPSAKKVFADWPTPIVTSGFEIGKTILFPASAIESKFSYVPNHPIADAYRQYQKMPYDRPTWDLTAVLYAVRPKGYFQIGATGRVNVTDDGRTTLEADPKGKQSYLTVDGPGREKALAAMIELSSRPPGK
jgi:inosine-uridine nucleoside N-ribohydrolase